MTGTMVTHGWTMLHGFCFVILWQTYAILEAIDLSLPFRFTPAMNSVLPATWKVPEIIRGRLGEQAGRQRTMIAENHLLLVLHDVPEPGEAERKALLFWREPDSTWHSTGSGSAIAELQAYIQRFNQAVDQLEAKMDEPPSARGFFQVLNASTPLLRTVRNMHKALQEAREAIPLDRNLLLARDQAVELERAVELLNSDARNGLDFMIAKQAEEQAEFSEALVSSSYKLNLLIAIFLPLTALGSAFGMNLKHGLENFDSPWLFWAVLIIGIFVGFMVKGSVTARPGANRRPPNPPTGAVRK